MRLLDWFWQHFDVLEVPELATEVDPLFRPGFPHDLDRLVETFTTLRNWHAEHLEFNRIEPAACTPVDPAASEHIQERHLFCQPERVVKSGQRDRHTDADVLGVIGHVQSHHVDRRANAVPREMVLCQPHCIVSTLIHDLDALHGTSVDRRQGDARLGPAEKLEYAELHSSIPHNSAGPSELVWDAGFSEASPKIRQLGD